MTTRLETFRGYMARLNPARDPLHAVRDGLYVPRPDRSAVDEISARIELDPTSSHLVVGGIGSGKTTQLLVARDRLMAAPDMHAEYIDVADLQDLTQLQPGILIVLAGRALSRLVHDPTDTNTREAKRQFQRWADGELERVEVPPGEGYPWGDPDEDDGSLADRQYKTIEHKPLVVPPEKPIDGSVQHKISLLSQLRATLGVPHLALLFDSLDRLSDPSLFTMLVEEDARAIHRAGIGLVLVGPLGSMYGPHRSVTDNFQHFYLQSTVDVRSDAGGRSFLVDLLRRRASVELLPDASAARLAAWSGGVLRDLVALARAAGEQAYMRGAARVEESDVDAAADAFGRQLVFGLGPEEIDVLRRVAEKGSFVQISDRDVALLVTRRVLEYPAGSPRFTVHPTVAPLLRQLEPMSVAS